MKRLKLSNITFVIDEYFEPYRVNNYTISSKHKKTSKYKRVLRHIKKSTREHCHNAFVEFSGVQEDSIIFKGGMVNNSRKIKLIEDILLIGSILTHNNWALFSRSDYPQYPVLPINHLDYICRDSIEIEKLLNKAVSKIKEPSWQIQYENGFHLLMLFNKANIYNYEGRFISYMVIWEWLYPHLKNPNGATSADESFNLIEIMNYIFNHYWGAKINNKLFTSSYKNIFYVLRNQLAHSCKLPIDRNYAEDWMKNLKWEKDKPTGKGIKDYLKFFGLLTQVIVLKTLDIDSEKSLSIWNFEEKLEKFLLTGTIDI